MITTQPLHHLPPHATHGSVEMTTRRPNLTDQEGSTDQSPPLTAPDRSTAFRASSIPTAHQVAEWCHPRGNPDRWLRESVATTATTSAATSAHVSPERLLGVWAHPDDEAYLSAGLMARTVAAGGQVTVVAMTDGEAGFPDDDPRPAEQRAEQRRRELRAAMGRIGVSDVRFLGIADGAVATAPADALVAEVGDIIRDVDPDAIVTFGPDGITGHSDHVANSDLVTRAWLDTRIGELWYAAKTDEWLAEWRELHDDFGVWMTEEPTGVRSDALEMVVQLDGVQLDTKRAVLAEHRSQTDGLAAAFGEGQYRRWIAEEVFRRPNDAELVRQRVLAGSVAS